ncbi:MAG: hypothetical protein JNM66_29305 [Bryobacterales bacterium]|nr:hypothetical protein [Bryobacterales bacterium]
MKQTLAWLVLAGLCLPAQTIGGAAAARAAKRAEDRKAANEVREAKRAENARQREAARAEGQSTPAADTKAPVETDAPDQGITGPLHEKHLRRVVFTKVDKGLAEIREADIVQEVTLGEPLFFRVFLEKSAAKLLKPKMPDMKEIDIANTVRWGVRFTAAGKAPVDVLMQNWGLASELVKWTTWRGVMVKDGSTAIPGMDAFGEFVSRGLIKGTLTPGKNVVKVEIYPIGFRNTAGKDERINGDVAASGQITLAYSGSITGASKLCPQDQQRLRDPGLEGLILRTAQQKWNTTEHKPAAIRITHDGWTIFRNRLTGVVTHRSIDAIVMARGAEYCQWEGYAFTQQHVGNGFDTGGSFTGSAGAHFMPCACVGK